MTEPTNTTSKRGSRWQPGQSGNPTGRPMNYGVAVRELRARVADHLDELVNRVLLAALSGDMTAAKLLLDKVLPNVKPESLPLAMSPLPTGTTFSDAARKLLDAALAGTVPPDVARDLIDGMSKVAAIEGIDELKRKLEDLESLA